MSMILPYHLPQMIFTSVSTTVWKRLHPPTVIIMPQATSFTTAATADNQQQNIPGKTHLGHPKMTFIISQPKNKQCSFIYDTLSKSENKLIYDKKFFFDVFFVG